jgi:hypothetical protein
VCFPYSTRRLQLLKTPANLWVHRWPGKAQIVEAAQRLGLSKSMARAAAFFLRPDHQPLGRPPGR